MYKKILFAIDFTKLSDEAIAKVVNVVKCSDAELVICHITQIALIDPTYEIGYSGDGVLEDKEYVAKEVAKILDIFLAQGITKIKYVSDVSLNVAYTITHDVYQVEHNDLVIVVGHKKKGLDRFLGSFAINITKNSKTDVLVIKEY